MSENRRGNFSDSYCT